MDLNGLKWPASDEGMMRNNYVRLALLFLSRDY